MNDRPRFRLASSVQHQAVEQCTRHVATEMFSMPDIAPIDLFTTCQYSHGIFSKGYRQQTQPVDAELPTRRKFSGSSKGSDCWVGTRYPGETTSEPATSVEGTVP